MQYVMKTLLQIKVENCSIASTEDLEQNGKVVKLPKHAPDASKNVS